MSKIDPNALVQQLKGNKLPPVHLWNPPLCGEMDMRIARDGTWYYRGSPIGRKSMVRLFSTVLRHDDDEHYYLVTPVEKLRIRVDDAPFLAVGLELSGTGESQVLTFRTNVDARVAVDVAHPIRVEHNPDSGEPSPYVLVRDRLEALIARAVYYELVELGVEREVGGERLFGVWSASAFFPLGKLDPG